MHLLPHLSYIMLFMLDSAVLLLHKKYTIVLAAQSRWQ